MDTMCKESIIEEEIQITEHYRGTFENISGEKTESKVLLFSLFCHLYSNYMSYCTGLMWQVLGCSSRGGAAGWLL